MKFTMKNSQSGFSLVELMTVVAIIGVLAAIAVPRMNNYRAKALQSEAKTNLGHMSTMQRSYIIENGVYALDMPTLGYTVPAGARYTYNTLVSGISTAEVANTVLCGGPAAGTNDQWSHSAATSFLSNGNFTATAGGTVKFAGCN